MLELKIVFTETEMKRKQILMAELKMKLKHVVVFIKWNGSNLSGYSTGGYQTSLRENHVWKTIAVIECWLYIYRNHANVA